MKKILNTMFPLLLLVMLVACHSDDAESAFEKNVNALTSVAWTHPTVTNSADGDLSASYADFAILFTKQEANGFAGTFVISNGGYAFTEVTGRWKFNDALTELQFDSGKTMTFTVDENHLSLDFTVAPPTGGRTDGLSGHFVFAFTK
jgi:hypothetical protein